MPQIINNLVKQETKINEDFGEIYYNIEKKRGTNKQK